MMPCNFGKACRSFKTGWLIALFFQPQEIPAGTAAYVQNFHNLLHMTGQWGEKRRRGYVGGLVPVIEKVSLVEI
jgi:hypothetical protein